MSTHLKVLFSSKALKAWVAGLMVLVSPYLVPALSEWLAQLTPEAVLAWFAGYGVTVSYALGTLIVGVLGLLGTYFIPNKRG